MSRVVEEARRWLGTPYRHQTSLRGAGCDCLGLLCGVWRELGGHVPVMPPYSPGWDEVARDDVLLSAARAHLVEKPVTRISAGDVLLFRMRRDAVAKHLGLVSGPDRFIHAYAKHGVVENALSGPWRRRVTAVFSFPNS